jgi:hypothetical protein
MEDSTTQQQQQTAKGQRMRKSSSVVAFAHAESQREKPKRRQRRSPAVAQHQWWTESAWTKQHMLELLCTCPVSLFGRPCVPVLTLLQQRRRVKQQRPSAVCRSPPEGKERACVGRTSVGNSAEAHRSLSMAVRRGRAWRGEGGWLTGPAAASPFACLFLQRLTSVKKFQYFNSEHMQKTPQPVEIGT